MKDDLIELIKAIELNNKEWLDPHELQSEYHISTSTQSKMRVAKTIPYHKIGKYVRYKREAINHWFEKAKVC